MGYSSLPTRALQAEPDLPMSGEANRLHGSPHPGSASRARPPHERGGDIGCTGLPTRALQAEPDLPMNGEAIWVAGSPHPGSASRARPPHEWGGDLHCSSLPTRRAHAISYNSAQPTAIGVSTP